MKNIFLTFAGIIVWMFSVQAQSAYDGGQFGVQGKGVVYDKEFTVDFRLHTNGFALAANFGKLKTYYKTRYYHFELGELRHPKEFRQSFDINIPNTNATSRSYVFGKQNNFYVLRAGIGEKRYFSEKAKKRGLAVGMSYEGGPSLGMLKPYYLKIIRYSDTGPNPGRVSDEKFSEDNTNVFLNTNNIYGSAGFGKGLGEISFMPGIHAKIAVHFDWGAFDEFVKAVEAGIMVDAYYKKVPILIDDADLSAFPTPEIIEPQNVQNRPFYINFFVNLQLGKRW